MLLPGLGQFVVGAYRRALVLLALTAAIVLAAAAVVLARPALGLRLLVAILALDAALLGLRLFAVVDAPAPEPEPPLPRGRPLAASPQVLTVAAAEHPWTTILLLGTDEGPGNWGARTDTIMLVAIEHGP